MRLMRILQVGALNMLENRDFRFGLDFARSRNSYTEAVRRFDSRRRL